MMKQKGEVSVGLVIGLVAVGFFGLIALTGFSSYVSAYNYGNTAENQLKAVQTDNRNILAQYGQKVQETAQVPAMYRDDLTKVLATDLGGRYGKNGSSATFQFLKEHNVNLDPKLYQQIQQIIESGRDNFENGQRHQIDVRRQYETQLGTFWGGMWLKFAGYPKINLADFDIVSTGRADDAFKNHREDGPINLKQ
jgi:hypothetical protein